MYYIKIQANMFPWDLFSTWHSYATMQTWFGKKAFFIFFFFQWQRYRMNIFSVEISFSWYFVRRRWHWTMRCKKHNWRWKSSRSVKLVQTIDNTSTITDIEISINTKINTTWEMCLDPIPLTKLKKKTQSNRLY